MAPPAPGAPATLAAGTYLVSAAQPLKHWIEALLGQSPSAGGPSTSDVNAWSRPLLMGIAGGTLGAPPPAAPAAAAPALAAAQPLAGRRLALLGDPARVRVGRPRRRAAQRGHELGALRPRPPRRAGRRGRRRGARRRRAGRPRCASWWPTARRRRSRPRRCRRSPPSSPAAGRSSAGARAASPWRARPGSRRRRSPPGAPATWIPGAAVAVGGSVVVDNDDPLVAGGHVVAAYGARAQRLDAGLAGRAPGDPRRARRRRPRRALRLRSRLPRRRARAPRRCSRLL